MRNIFCKTVLETQQGCIFTGAIADGFDDCTVYGLIVTPRCDIAQRKVMTVHYLPVVALDDWKRVVLAQVSQLDRLDKKRAEVINLCNKYKIPVHLVDRKYRLPDADMERLIPDKTLQQKVIEPLKECWNLQDIKFCYESLDTWNNYSNRLTELVDGKNERYLLLEDWKNSKQHFVICLTEIYHITLDISLKLSNGILVRDIDFEKNDLRKSDNRLEEYKVQSQLSSPYIEYVTQRLSNAFFRIGIDDWADRKQTVENIK